jgi:hypothetical protein
MSKATIPNTDSIKELAEFFDSHRFEDYEDQLEEVAQPVFARRDSIQVTLESGQVESLERMAAARGVSKEDLAKEWLVQRLATSPGQ